VGWHNRVRSNKRSWRGVGCACGQRFTDPLHDMSAATTMEVRHEMQKKEDGTMMPTILAVVATTMHRMV
jgi:hypothetical protein